MTGFHEVRFRDNIAYGATGGPEFTATIVVTGSGHEQRNINCAEARGRWDVASGLKNQQQLDELIDFFCARKGRAYGSGSRMGPITRRWATCSARVMPCRLSSSW